VRGAEPAAEGDVIAQACAAAMLERDRTARVFGIVIAAGELVAAFRGSCYRVGGTVLEGGNR
jgi:hypothetical protein